MQLLGPQEDLAKGIFNTTVWKEIEARIKSDAKAGAVSGVKPMMLVVGGVAGLALLIGGLSLFVAMRRT